MPNLLAYMVLFGWPLVILGLFRRLPPGRALIWSILGGYLLLPPIANVDLPLIPPLDKASIPNLTAFVVCLALIGRTSVSLPDSRLTRLLLLMFVFTPVATALTNSEPIIFAKGALPGLSIYDSISFALAQLIAIMPFVLGRNLLATEEAQRDLLKALAVAGLAYSIPMLIEVRLSPQLNVWIYGFFQHAFDQMMRYGGFRPIVFLEHGLWVALFAMMAFVSALVLAKTESANQRGRYVFFTFYLGVVLVLCKSAASLVYAAALVSLLVFTTTRTQMRVAMVLATIVLVYPLLRSLGLIPIDDIMSLANWADPDRAQSLGFRTNNENLLLAHAAEKPLFGWGGWGRNFVYDFLTGKRITTVDGRWIIVMGVAGWVGYLAEFGLLALPVLMLMRVAKTEGENFSKYAAPLALLFAFTLVDLLPNATLIPMTWLIAGSMLGYVEGRRAEIRPTANQPAIYGYKRADKAATGRPQPIPLISRKPQ